MKALAMSGGLFSSGCSGSYAAIAQAIMDSADQGANVIKVERPEGGDTARGGAPKIKNEKGETQSGYFLRFNRNKRSVTLNTTPTDYNAIKQMRLKGFDGARWVPLGGIISE